MWRRALAGSGARRRVGVSLLRLLESDGAGSLLGLPRGATDLMAAAIACPNCQTEIVVAVRVVDPADMADRGRARMARLSPEERKALAKKALKARWAKPGVVGLSKLRPTVEDVAAATGHALGCSCVVCLAAREVSA